MKEVLIFKLPDNTSGSMLESFNNYIERRLYGTNYQAIVLINKVEVLSTDGQLKVINMTEEDFEKLLENKKEV